MSNHDHSVDQHEDGPESAQLAAVKSIQTEHARRSANTLRSHANNIAAIGLGHHAARVQMTTDAAWYLSVYGGTEPTTDREAAADAILRAIFKRGSE